MYDFNRIRTETKLINSYLLAAIFFFIPIKIGPAYILSILILLLWLLEGNLQQKWYSLYRHPLTWIFWLYFLLPFISLFWSSDLIWGLKMAKKGILFLLFPLFVSVTRKEHIRMYITVFIASVGITEALSYYNWFQLHYFTELPEGIRAIKDEWQIAPFVNHIMYNPILAFAAYLLGHAVLFENLKIRRKLAYWFFLVTISINMLISGGRSGQAGFLAMIALLVFQRFARRPVLAVAASLGASAVVFFAGYQTSDLFRERVDLALHEIHNYEQVVNSSVGLRINMAVNTIRMIKQSPVFGVGVGDYPVEYARINAQYTPKWMNTFNPHNQFLFDLSTMGILGGVSLVALLFTPIFFAGDDDEEKHRIKMALLILFLVICLGESYLWRSNTRLMFVTFNAILCSNSFTRKD